MNKHPDTTAEKLRTVFLNANPGYQPLPVDGHLVYVPQEVAPAAVTQLAPGLFGFSAGYGEIGNVFLVAHRDGRFQVMWDARTPSASGISKFPTLAAWTAENARNSCRTGENEARWDQCGPIHGGFERLPPDSLGNIRFYIDATYAQAAGETVRGQISIWSWNGTVATPLLVKSYTYVFEDAVDRFENGIIKIHVKDEYKSYYSCGACLGRQLDWAIRVGPDRIVDLGMHPLRPELDTVDDLFQRIEKARPSADIADPRAVAKLKSLLASAWDAGKNPPELDLGMVGGAGVRRYGARAVACLGIDAADGEFDFTIERRDSHFFITDVVHRSDGGACR